MTKVSDFPDGYDVEEFIKGCESIWHNILYSCRSMAPTEFLCSYLTSVGRPQPLFSWLPT